MHRSHAPGELALLASLAVLGCAAPATSETGIRLGDKTLQQFKAGETTSEWLIALVGEPTSQSSVPGQPNVRILRYSTVEKTSGFLSLLTGGGSRTTATIYFVVKDGIVASFWADREIERTLLGKEVEKKSGEKEK